MSTVTTALDGSPSGPTPFKLTGRQTMSLRKKSFFVVAGTMAALIVILWISLSWILVGRFRDVERRAAASDVEIAGATLTAYFVPLRNTALGWSAWGESYQFVQDGNAVFREANLTAADLSNSQIDVIAFVQPDGHITFGAGINSADRTLDALPRSLTALLTANSLLVGEPSAGRQVSGLVALPEGTMLTVAYPIVRDDGSGPSHGALIVGRYFTKADLALVQGVTRLDSLALEPRSAQNLPATMKSAVKQLDAGSKTVEQPVSSKLMLSTMLMPDVFGKPSFILQAGVDRTTYNQSRMALHDLVLALIIAGGVFLGVTLLLLEWLVLRRLATISRGVRSIGSRRDFATRLNPDGSDEIGQLASAINQMLQDLGDAQVRERRLNEEITQLHIQIDGARRDREVAQITDSDYFRDLAERADNLRRRNPRATNTSA